MRQCQPWADERSSALGSAHRRSDHRGSGGAIQASLRSRPPLRTAPGGHDWDEWARRRAGVRGTPAGPGRPPVFVRMPARLEVRPQLPRPPRVVLRDAAAAQQVVADDELLESERPEAWAMHYMTASTLMTSFGPVPALRPGGWQVAAELGEIPHLDHRQTVVGFNGTKPEDLNKSPVIGRVRGWIGLPAGFVAELAWTPPVEIDGAKAARSVGRRDRTARVRCRRHRRLAACVRPARRGDRRYHLPRRPRGHPGLHAQSVRLRCARRATRCR